MNNILSSDLKIIKGIGKNSLILLEKLNIKTIKDLLFFIPYRYEKNIFLSENIKNLENDQIITFSGKIIDIKEVRTKTRGNILKILIKNKNLYLECIWFNFKYIKDKLKINSYIKVQGKIYNIINSIPQVVHPEIAILNNEEDINLKEEYEIIPFYHLTEGLSQKAIRKYIRAAWELAKNYIQEELPEEIISGLKLLKLKDAIYSIHYPKTIEEAIVGRKRIVYENIFYIQVFMHLRKKSLNTSLNSFKLLPKKEGIKKLYNKLPFKLTNSQIKVIKELLADLESDYIMHRLLQGDVGSGKTIVALFVSLMVIENGYQVALMVPTEILAKQHFDKISNFLKDFNIRIALLTGNIKNKEKEQLIEDLKNHKIDFIIGTHSLIQETIEFRKLGLVIIDEQHRFGVEQRAYLLKKNEITNMLVMTATPIPRSLALTIYGDLDISILDEVPEGRLPIKTFLRTEDKRKAIYEFLEKIINRKEQIYVVCPLIETTNNEDNQNNLLSVEKIAEKIKNEYLTNARIAILHGKMKDEEKDKILYKFRNKEFDILVSTTIIEVGIDIPDATVMIIENADRFGLAQLHQLRGRVGRSNKQSYCILIVNNNISKEAKERLEFFTTTTNGFKIAEYDMQNRGYGEFLGNSQHGGFLNQDIYLLGDSIFLDASKKLIENIFSNNNIFEKYPHIKNILEEKFLDYKSYIFSG